MVKALRRILVYASMLVGLAATSSAHAAQIVPPDLLAKNVTNNVLAILKTDKRAKAGDLRDVERVIESKILPYFDFETMTRYALGSNWRQATHAQRQALIRQFRRLLVRVYAASLAQYRDQTVKYEPVRLARGDSNVVVRSQIMRSGQEPVSVDYSMEKTADGWKVYDLKIDGMSLVENYRNEFNSRIQIGGINGLIRALADKNKALA